MTISATLPPPPPPLISVASKTKKCWKLKQSTLKGGEGRGSGKGLSSGYSGHWKLEKVFFNESVSTILQLVVALPDKSFLRVFFSFCSSIEYILRFQIYLSWHLSFLGNSSDDWSSLKLINHILRLRFMH